MFDLFKAHSGKSMGVDFAALVREGAQIIDVRSEAEYLDGHIAGSVNISVQSLPSRLGEIKRDKAVITCCASGARSSIAKKILEAGGFHEVHNGGGWRQLQARLS
jgi:phage shock protein E